MTGIPCALATARAGDSNPLRITRAFAFKSFKKKSKSLARYAGFNGALTAQADMDKNDTAASGPLGTTIATRSFLPIPSTFSLLTILSMCSAKPRYVIERRPGAEIAAASGAFSLWALIRSQMQRPGAAFFSDTIKSLTVIFESIALRLLGKYNSTYWQKRFKTLVLV